MESKKSRLLLVKVFITTVTLLFLTACSAKPNIVLPPTPFTVDGENEVYVVSHGWHTGFVVPAKMIKQRIPELERRFSHANYIEFGWGDKGFYQAKEITTGLTLQAIFWPTPSVIHAVAVPDDVRHYFQESEIAQICLTDSELAHLIDFIDGSFAREEGKLVRLKTGIYGDSQFYKGTGDYYLMNTCNKWTAKGLKSMGMDVSTTFKLTASSVMNYLDDKQPADMMCFSPRPQ